MGRIDVIGLGPADESFVTTETLAVIAAARVGFVRTRRHPSAQLVEHFESFDDVYEGSESIDDVYEEIVKRLVGSAQTSDIVYAVPGSPLVAERTVSLLRDVKGVEMVVHPAMSYLDLCWSRLGIDPLAEQVQLVDGHGWLHGEVFASGAVLIAQCDSKEVLSAIKLSADGDSKVVVLQRLGLPDENIQTVAWADVDREVEPDHLTSLWIADFPANVGSSLVQLNDVIKQLRLECPWDREQTHQTLAKHLLEEAYEAVEAIGEKDTEHLIEELGDVFMQVFMHAAIATEAGEFTITDVSERIREKLIHRHPHVFGDFDASTSAEVEANWEKLKAAEGKPTDEIDVSKALPSLLYASEVRDRLAKQGIEYESLDSYQQTIENALKQLVNAGANDQQKVELLGEVLLGLVSLANVMGIDSETALRSHTVNLRS